MHNAEHFFGGLQFTFQCKDCLSPKSGLQCYIFIILRNQMLRASKSTEMQLHYRLSRKRYKRRLHNPPRVQTLPKIGNLTVIGFSHSSLQVPFWRLKICFLAVTASNVAIEESTPTDSTLKRFTPHSRHIRRNPRMIRIPHNHHNLHSPCGGNIDR